MSGNMICPACNKFQPKADTCSDCGVVIAKVQPAAPAPDAAKEVASQAPEKSSLPVVGGVIAVIVVVGGYLLTSGESEKEAPPTADAQPSQLQEATSGRLNHAAAAIQRARTQEKLRALVTKLNIQMIELQAFEPPTTAEGLSKLVRDGVLQQSDIVDGWRNEFVYELKMGKDMGVLGQEYEMFLHSAGPDGISGTADDIGM